MVPHTDSALDSIEASILPNTSLLLDGLLDSAALALPGIDCEAHARRLRSLALQVDHLTQLIASLAPPQEAARARISA